MFLLTFSLFSRFICTIFDYLTFAKSVDIRCISAVAEEKAVFFAFHRLISARFSKSTLYYSQNNTVRIDGKHILLVSYYKSIMFPLLPINEKNKFRPESQLSIGSSTNESLAARHILLTSTFLRRKIIFL